MPKLITYTTGTTVVKIINKLYVKEKKDDRRLFSDVYLKSKNQNKRVTSKLTTFIYQQRRSFFKSILSLYLYAIYFWEMVV